MTQIVILPPRLKGAALFALLLTFLAGGVTLRFVQGPYQNGPRMLGLDSSASVTEDPVCLDSGKPRPGQPISGLLAERGVSPSDANDFLPRLSALMDLRRATPRDEVRLHSDRGGLLRRLEYHPRGGGSAGSFFIVSRDSAGFRAWREDEPLEAVVRKHTGEVRGSLFASMTRAGLLPAQIDQFCDIFSCDVDFLTATRDGDRWEMLTEELVDPSGARVRPGRFLGGRYINVDTPYEAFYYAPELVARAAAVSGGAALDLSEAGRAVSSAPPEGAVTGLAPIGASFQDAVPTVALGMSGSPEDDERAGSPRGPAGLLRPVLPHDAPTGAPDAGEKNSLLAEGTNGAYYRADGQSLRRAFLKAPLNYRRISSGYTNRRLHPIFKVVRPHHGVDYAAPYGTPVVAISDGTVFSAGWMRGYGRLLRIRHRDGIVTYSAHLSRFAAGLEVGDAVKQGQVVGYVGVSGNATGPHLDFRIEQDGQFIDPLRFRSTGGEPLVGSDRATFLDMVEGYRAVLDSLDAGDCLGAREFAGLLFGADEAGGATAAAERSAEPTVH